jgi:hypothetical protein
MGRLVRATHDLRIEGLSVASPQIVLLRRRSWVARTSRAMTIEGEMIESSTLIQVSWETL